MTDKKLYEIKNPSDPVHVEAADQTVACVAVLLLGSGRYGLSDERDETVLPLLFFGGHEKWLESVGIADLGVYIDTHASALVDVLESATVGSVKDFAFYKSAMAAIDDPVKRDAFRDEWDDKKRSSMNDICAHARSLAQHLRQRAATLSAAVVGSEGR